MPTWHVCLRIGLYIKKLFYILYVLLFVSYLLRGEMHSVSNKRLCASGSGTVTWAYLNYYICTSTYTQTGTFVLQSGICLFWDLS